MKVKHNIDIERISIDTSTYKDIDSIYEKLDLDSSQIICNNWNINSVYYELKSRKVPDFKIIPTRNLLLSHFIVLRAQQKEF